MGAMPKRATPLKQVKKSQPPLLLPPPPPQKSRKAAGHKLLAWKSWIQKILSPLAESLRFNSQVSPVWSIVCPGRLDGRMDFRLLGRTVTTSSGQWYLNLFLKPDFPQCLTWTHILGHPPRRRRRGGGERGHLCSIYHSISCHLESSILLPSSQNKTLLPKFFPFFFFFKCRDGRR